RFCLAALAALLITIPALGQGSEGVGSFRRNQPAAEPPSDETPEVPWGPVPSSKISTVNLAPILLPFFNNGTVFGIPGTELGSVRERTQLTGEWWGARSNLATRGLFVDFYTTSVYQDVVSGGLRTGSSFVQNMQTSINLDTGRAGLWSGGLIHFTLQSRYG